MTILGMVSAHVRVVQEAFKGYLRKFKGCFKEVSRVS